MMRNTPPFRADHVGSLLRPPALLAAREACAAGAMNAQALRMVEDQAIEAVVGMQEDLGLQVATDGDFRRASWQTDFIYALGGIGPSDDTIEVEFRSDRGTSAATPRAHRVSGQVRLDQPIFLDDFGFLRRTVTTATPKITIPSPSMVHYFGGAAAIDSRVYPDLGEFWRDLTAAYAAEVAALAEAGCTYLQIDDTSLAFLADPRQRQWMASQGGDPERQHLLYIEQVNAALAGKPESMAVTVHTCRGNFRCSWAAEGGYDYVAEALFNELRVDGFFLEYDDARSGGFEPLRFVPKGTMVVLGLVTTKRPALESKEDLKRRIDEASKYVPLDQLCLSPQCGFASNLQGNLLTLDDEKAKLRLVAETAREVWA
jgi:5-methyltetrahydropteroyltriglutamate--homocysteine methyltransferase